MKTVEDFPFEVVEEDDIVIPMSDGICLAARIWRPEEGESVPAILEYIPYRKRFGTAVRDVVTHRYLAGHGYACVRVDLRGSGESDGVLKDEYLQQELDDGIEIIDWLASQPWCDGAVGMMGISWGGFNALQIAALRPPALKAVVTLCSTDDRYADDIHHMGGCLLGDNLSWASVMFAYNSLPPDPVLVGERWRDMWMERLEDSGLWLKAIEQWRRLIFDNELNVYRGNIRAGEACARHLGDKDLALYLTQKIADLTEEQMIYGYQCNDPMLIPKDDPTMQIYWRVLDGHFLAETYYAIWDGCLAGLWK